MTSGYRKARKELAEKMAGDPVDIDRSTLDDGGKRIWCAAANCPMKASVYFGSAVCSWHDVAAKTQWPAVTAELAATIAAGGKPQRPALRQSAQSLADAAKVRAYLGNRTAPPSAFAHLAERLHKRLEDRKITGLDDDQVNALLQVERS